MNISPLTTLSAQQAGKSALVSQAKAFETINPLQISMVDHVSFSGKVKKSDKVKEDFAQALFTQITDQMGIQNKPVFAITNYPTAGGFMPSDGTFKFNQDVLHKLSPQKIANVVRHELRHFEQFSKMFRACVYSDIEIDGAKGMDAAVKLMEIMDKRDEEAYKRIQDSCIYDNPLFKDADKKQTALEAAGKRFDKEPFIAFWEKVVEEQGPISSQEEMVDAVKFIKALLEYPMMNNLSAGIQSFDNIGAYLKFQATLLKDYVTNPLELDAIKTASAYVKENKEAIKEQYQALMEPEK